MEISPKQSCSFRPEINNKLIHVYYLPLTHRTVSCVTIVMTAKGTYYY